MHRQYPRLPVELRRGSLHGRAGRGRAVRRQSPHLHVWRKSAGRWAITRDGCASRRGGRATDRPARVRRRFHPVAAAATCAPTRRARLTATTSTSHGRSARLFRRRRGRLKGGEARRDPEPRGSSWRWLDRCRRCRRRSRDRARCARTESPRRDVHALVEVQQLQRDQPLVVVAGPRRVEAPGRRRGTRRRGRVAPRSRGEARGRDARARRLDRRAHQALFLVAEAPGLAGVRVQPRDRHPRRRDAEAPRQRLGRQPDRRSDAIRVSRPATSRSPRGWSRRSRAASVPPASSRTPRGSPRREVLGCGRETGSRRARSTASRSGPSRGPRPRPPAAAVVAAAARTRGLAFAGHKPRAPARRPLHAGCAEQPQQLRHGHVRLLIRRPAPGP